MPDDTLVDFAVVAFQEDGQWQIGRLPHRAAEDLDDLASALRQQPSEGALLGLSSYGDDFFLALRPDGADLRVLVSDASAAGDWAIAEQALALAEETVAADVGPLAPAGDLEIFADLGVGAMELRAVCGDDELYPDEMLGQIAARIGFGAQLDRALDDDLT